MKTPCSISREQATQSTTKPANLFNRTLPCRQRLKLLHRRRNCSPVAVNSFIQGLARPCFYGRKNLFPNCSPDVLENNPVHKVPLFVHENPVCCPQFIERTESGGGNRKITLRDSWMIPGDWGKAGPGWLARPLSSRKQFRGRRQDSPVPMARSRVPVTRSRTPAIRSD